MGTTNSTQTLNENVGEIINDPKLSILKTKAFTKNAIRILHSLLKMTDYISIYSPSLLSSLPITGYSYYKINDIEYKEIYVNINNNVDTTTVGNLILTSPIVDGVIYQLYTIGLINNEGLLLNGHINGILPEDIVNVNSTEFAATGGSLSTFTSSTINQAFSNFKVKRLNHLYVESRNAPAKPTNTHILQFEKTGTTINLINNMPLVFNVGDTRSYDNRIPNVYLYLTNKVSTDTNTYMYTFVAQNSPTYNSIDNTNNVNFDTISQWNPNLKINYTFNIFDDGTSSFSESTNTLSDNSKLLDSQNNLYTWIGTPQLTISNYHTLTDGSKVKISEVEGTTELNYNTNNNYHKSP